MKCSRRGDCGMREGRRGGDDVDEHRTLRERKVKVKESKSKEKQKEIKIKERVSQQGLFLIVPSTRVNYNMIPPPSPNLKLTNRP